VLGVSTEQWGVISALAAAAASFIAALALVAALFGLRHNTRALQVQVLESVFRDIRELDREYIADFESMSRRQQTAWSSTFFNTVEYLCFLVHTELAPRGALQEFFFDQALPAWKEMFDQHVTDKVLRDGDDQFKEFKRASTGKARR
jgi:hypothetical protein